MTITALLVFGSASLVLGICTVLVFHPDYDDSLWRRIALAGLAVGAYLRLAGILDHEEGMARSFSNVAIIVWFSLAMFLADHFYNFLRKSKAARDRRRRQGDKNGSGRQAA